MSLGVASQYARRVNSAKDDDSVVAQLRTLVVRRFRLDDEQLTLDQPLFDGTLGLDSLDAIEFGMLMEDKFGVTLDHAAEARPAFASLGTLAAFLRRQASLVPSAAPPPWPVPRSALA